MRINSELVGGKELAPILCQYIMERVGRPSVQINSANAIGLIRGDRILVAVAYDNFHWPDIQMHVAADPGAVWASPEFLYHAFAYPFLQLQCRRVTGLVPRKNRAIRTLAEKLGFKLEGTHKDALPTDDLMSYGLLKANCRHVNVEQRKAA